MNIYPRLSVFKQRLGPAVATVPGGGDDVSLLAKLEKVSRDFDEATGIHLYARVAQTRYTRGSRWQPTVLNIGRAAAVTSVAVDENQDGTFEKTLALDTDYWLEPVDAPANTPYTHLVLNPNGTQIYRWPLGRRQIKVVLTEGFSYEAELTLGTVQNSGSISSSGTSLTLPANNDIEIGETYLFGTEQFYVSAKPDNVTATIVRGVNGTTAAAQLNGVAIYRREYPVSAMEAMYDRARYLWHAEYRGGPAVDSYNGTNTQSWLSWRDMIAQYRMLPAVA